MGIAALDPQNGLPYSWNPGRYPRAPACGHSSARRTASGSEATPTTSTSPITRASRSCPWPGKEHPAGEPGVLPGDLYTVGAGATAMRRSFDGTVAGAPTAVTGFGLASASIRGAFMLSGQLYLAWSNGHMDVRSFDGTAAGTPKTIDLHGLTAGRLPVSKLTGMFYADGRLYYTVNGDRHLFWRWFEPQGRVVGAQRFVVPAAWTGAPSAG